MKTEIYESEMYQEKLKEHEQLPIARRVWLGGLTYQCCFEQKEYTWKEAKAYLEKLSDMEGYHWRLPTLSELEKLLTKAPYKSIKGDKHYIQKNFLDFMPTESIFWSNSSENKFGIWVVDFNQGYYYLRDKTAKYHLLAVCDSKLA